jgi:hypothetical protein
MFTLVRVTRHRTFDWPRLVSPMDTVIFTGSEEECEYQLVRSLHGLKEGRNRGFGQNVSYRIEEL